MAKRLIDYAGDEYLTTSEDSEKTCINCAKYKPVNDMMGICYEYEVLPQGYCKFFEPRNK